MERYFICSVSKREDITFFNPAQIITADSVLTSLPGSFSSCYMSVNPVIDQPVKNDKGSYSTTFESGNFIAKNYLFEFDNMDLREQLKIIQPLKDNKVVGRIVYSGKKSIHSIIQTNHICKTAEEYKFIWTKLRDKYFNGLNPDEACTNVSRWSRCPNHIRIETGKNQELLYWNTEYILDVSDIVSEYNEHKNKQSLFKMVKKHKSPYIKSACQDYHNLPSFKLAMVAQDNEREKPTYCMLYAMRQNGYSDDDMLDALDEVQASNGISDKTYKNLVRQFKLL